MGDVVQFNGDTRLDIEPDLVLEGARGNLQEVLVIGYENDELYVAFSSGDIGKNLLLMELAKKLLLED